MNQREEKKKELEARWRVLLPDVPPMFCDTLYVFGIVSVDVVKLDWWMKENKGYKDDNTSLATFLTVTYSKEAADFIRSAL